MTTEQDLKLAKRCARPYARAVWYSDPEDLEQEALLTILLARRTWKPALGAFAKYARRAIEFNLGKLTWRLGSPVHAGKNRLPSLEGTRSVPLDEALVASAPSPEEEAGASRWREAIRERLEAIDEQGVGSEALLVNPQDVAWTRRLPVKKVYQEMDKVRKRARRDPKMKRLWSER